MVAYQEISQSSVGRSVRVGLGKLLVAGALSLLGWEVLGPNTARAERAQGEAWLGSYGRVGFSSDESGGEGDRVAITPYAPRPCARPFLARQSARRGWRGRWGRNAGTVHAEGQRCVCGDDGGVTREHG